MSSLAAGKRLKSAVCTTEIMVIAAPDGDVDLRCGGAPMAEDASSGGAPSPNFDNGSAIGKRYVNGDGTLELLCVKAGDGSLSVGDDALAVKDAKKLPKTD